MCVCFNWCFDLTPAMGQTSVANSSSSLFGGMQDVKQCARSAPVSPAVFCTIGQSDYSVNNTVTISVLPGETFILSTLQKIPLKWKTSQNVLVQLHFHNIAIACGHTSTKISRNKFFFPPKIV